MIRHLFVRYDRDLGEDEITRRLNERARQGWNVVTFQRNAVGDLEFVFASTKHLEPADQR